MKTDFLTQQILNRDGKPTEILLKISRIAGIEKASSLAELVTETQRAWLRKKNTERWEIEDSYADKKDQLDPLFKLLGFFEPVYPASKRYAYGLLLGDTVQGMQARLMFLKKLIDSGTIIDQLVLLTGQRFLTDQEQDYLNLCLGYNGQHTSETEAFLFLLEKIELNQATVSVVDTPKRHESGSARRPNTADTVFCWLAKNPAPNTCLAISCQPFLPYQHLTLREILPLTFMLETCGPVEPEMNSTSLYLDSLARWLYQELRLANMRTNTGQRA